MILTIEQIMLVRACKDNCDCIKRLRQITGHAMLVNADDGSYDMQIAIELIKILEQRKGPVRDGPDSLTINIICNASPENYWKFSYDKDVPYATRVMRVCASFIRFTNVSEFENYIAPIRLRHR